MSLKTVLITGGNLGLGYECAKSLAKNNPEYFIVIASRNKARTEQAVNEIISFSNNKNIIGMSLDLASIKSINNFVSEFKNKNLPPLYALVCNAGLQTKDTQYTEDGFELTFGVNHLGHFLLTHLLLNDINESGRIIVVASGTHDPEKKTGMPNPEFTSVNQLAYPSQETKSNGRLRYTTSKLCNVLTTYQLHKKFRDINKNITVNAFDPGLMPDTGLTRDYPMIARFFFNRLVHLLSFFMKNVNMVETSGQNLAYLVSDKSLENVSGKYFEGRKIINSSKESYDTKKSEELYNDSFKLLKMEESLLLKFNL